MTGRGAPSDPTNALLRAVAAHGLCTSCLELPDRIDHARWPALLAEVGAQRLSGHLLEAIAAGALVVTDAQAEAAAEQHDRYMTSALWLEQLLLEVVERFDGAGIDHRVLKGCAVAHLDYPDPSTRCFGDVDLLIRSEHVDDAYRLLAAAGYQRRFPEPRPGFDRRFGKGAAFVSPSGLEVDLHRTLALGPFGLAIDLSGLWTGSQPYILGGRWVHALGREHRFLHACYHAALGDPAPRLVALRDIAQMLEPRTDPIDTAALLAAAASWRGEAVLARAVGQAAATLGLAQGELIGWARQHRPSRRDQMALAAYTGPRASSAARSIAGVGAVPGFRSKAAYLHAVAFPAGRSALQRAGGVARRWRAIARRRVRASS